MVMSDLKQVFSLFLQTECIDDDADAFFDVRMPYSVAGEREKFRLASENSSKLDIDV